jgi:hypothetical protein
MAELTHQLVCDSNRSPPLITEQTKEPHMSDATKTLSEPQDSDTVPTFFYACEYKTSRLYRTNLLTGEQICLKVPSQKFKYYCRWTELPGGNLLITGGGSLAQRKVVKIDTLRECAVSSQPPIHTARCSHAAVYHSQYLYVLGGCSYSSLRECERYVCAESRWEVLSDLPVASCAMSAVVLNNSLYALGGSSDRGDIDTVQKLSLDSLTWELMQLKLPQAASCIPCFKVNTQVYLVIEETLYSFTPLQVKPIKTLTEGILCYSSYYSRGTLYYSAGTRVSSLAVGELSSL